MRPFAEEKILKRRVTSMKKQPIWVLLGLLLLVSLACAMPGGSLPDVTVPDDAAATAASAAQQAGQAAATIAAVASENSDELLATVQASDFQINVNVESLREKFTNLQPDANGNISVTLTDDEINQAIQGQNVAQQGISLQGIGVTFTGGNVVLTAMVTEPLQAQMTASFQPQVIDGQLQFTLVSAVLGRLPVPPAVLQSVEQTLNTTIGQLIASIPADYRLQDIDMGEGTMTIVARPAN
jgi:hypothetical protein